MSDWPIRVFSPDGVVTFEMCPVCQEPGVRVEHGEAANLIDGIAYGTRIEQKLWHCPNCGDSVATVVRLTGIATIYS